MQLVVQREIGLTWQKAICYENLFISVSVGKRK